MWRVLDKTLVLLTFLLLSSAYVKADDGYRLWLKYDKIDDTGYLRAVDERMAAFVVLGHSDIAQSAREELKLGLSGLLGRQVPSTDALPPQKNCLIVAKGDAPMMRGVEMMQRDLSSLKKGGYLIREIKVQAINCLAIVANDDAGLLYGSFHFLRLLQTRQSLNGINIKSSPQIQLRMLNHWDNLDGSVERGYGGKSLWKWDELPFVKDQRYIDYARACASVGINAVVLNNVNANPKILTPAYLVKVAALERIFSCYGIQVYLSANFAAPKVLGGLPTADPMDERVEKWWADKVAEIYELMPDFGGFLVKANSEGQPGPGDYCRSHAQGANMIARALDPFGGLLIWRAFVYDMKAEEDRIKMAYDEFKGLDGKFDDNVLVQIKNGPLDFQPREPVSPLLGAMPNTSQALELQITNEYLGHNKALVFLAPLFEECLDTDVYSLGPGSTVASIINGRLGGPLHTAIAGVANTGQSRDWTGFIFGQANWFAFGRLAWNQGLSSGQIADEWIKMTLTRNADAVKTIKDIMLGSREVLVNYQMPLGLNILSGYDHYSPNPAIRTYYHKADRVGLGFDRTSSGSNAVGQYARPLRDSLNAIELCPEKFLCWFHHVPWNYRLPDTMSDGSPRIFWKVLCEKYDSGVSGVMEMQRKWNSLKGCVDGEIFTKTRALLEGQLREAVKWRDTCLKYFQGFSEMDLPDTIVL